MMDSSIGRLTDRLSSCKLHLNKIEQVLEQFSSSSNKENEEVELINDIKEIINQVKESNGEKKKLLEKLQFNSQMIKHIQQDFHDMLFEKMKKLTSDEYITKMNNNHPKRVEIGIQGKETLAPKHAALQLKSIDLLSLETFNKIPKHIKGRLTLEQVNNGIVEINKILKVKQDFLRKPISKLTLVDRKKRGEYSKGLIELKGNLSDFFLIFDIF